ncbi:Ino eighty subunit 1 [Talaromyces islandicus]|uniref:Ino eighty subunit 1 n=1 Tax=Talaromyces islandicus TaxID=28573 RepID=A0A0U1LX86_TALIS|nr:Ino eighty subunit 1 [Talaromyces islandicus]
MADVETAAAAAVVDDSSSLMATPGAPTGDRDPHSEAGDDQPPTAHSTVSATVGTRRQANGTIGSVYSGNKIKHLKKEDGIPLWRKDIQYQFLKLVFEDKTPVFTRNSDGAKNLDFADIYIDAMARSSKTSKILKDKLQNDKQAAISMAMVCLLVNFGRMNTTLNFFPEMRAQLRTYHSIPSLQADQDPNAYKQLQDAPRLKSILKGASEDMDQPPTIEKIKEGSVPRTNPVHLIFLLAQYAPKISETHFFAPRDFFDLVMRSTLSSKSRARAFLWLMWWYLESDFSREAALNNPFGAGLDGEGTGGLPIKVPAFESLTEEQANEENKDTPEEIKYGEEKRLERKRILEEDEPLPRITKRIKKQESGYDDDQIGSANSTPLHPSTRRIIGGDEEEDWSTPGSARPRYKKPKRESSLNRSTAQRLVLKTRMDQTSDAASPAPPGSSHPVLNQFVNDSAVSSHGVPTRRPRPLTQHQLAVEQNRRHRIEYLLAQRKTEVFKVIRTRREREPAILRYKRILPDLPHTRSIEEEEFWGTGDQQEDYGEAAHYFLSVIRKASRRLDRWDWEKANGPTKDRKKVREERQKAYQNGTAVGYASGRAGQSSRSARPRPPRPSKRKTIAPSTPSNVSKPGAAVSSKNGDAGVSQQTMSDAVDDTPIKTDQQAPSSSLLAGIIPAGRSIDPDLDGDETLDDVDKDGLQEGSGHEDEDDSELSYGEDDHDDEGEGEGDEDELEEGEADVDGYGDYSTFEGRNGYDSYSEAGEDDVDGDDAMEE